MAENAPNRPAPDLATLRAEIDRLDRVIHDALIERSSVIEALIIAKQTAEKGASFRPAREADMLRRLASRHSGILPFTVIEHIWREIIAAFTQMQGAFTVHVEETEDRVMRDAVRYHFGFSTPISGHHDARDVVSAVLAQQNDLGLLQMTEEAQTPWWEALVGTRGQVIARYPFVVGAPHGAETACLLIARDVTEQAPLDFTTYAARLTDMALDLVRRQAGFSVLACAPAQGALRPCLIAAPRHVDASALIAQEGADGAELHPVGGYSSPIVIG